MTKRTNFTNESPNLTQYQSDELYEALNQVKEVIGDLIDMPGTDTTQCTKTLHLAVQNIVNAARNGQ